MSWDTCCSLVFESLWRGIEKGKECWYNTKFQAEQQLSEVFVSNNIPWLIGFPSGITCASPQKWEFLNMQTTMISKPQSANLTHETHIPSEWWWNRVHTPLYLHFKRMYEIGMNWFALGISQERHSPIATKTSPKQFRPILFELHIIDHIHYSIHYCLM